MEGSSLNIEEEGSSSFSRKEARIYWKGKITIAEANM